MSVTNLFFSVSRYDSRLKCCGCVVCICVCMRVRERESVSVRVSCLHHTLLSWMLTLTPVNHLRSCCNPPLSPCTSVSHTHTHALTVTRSRCK